MADLIEKAPPETPVTPSDGVQPPVTPEPGKEPPKEGDKRPPIDLDARLEEVLAEGRRVSDLDKQVAARLKRAEEIEAKYGPKIPTIDQHMTKGERAAAVKALLDGQIDEDLLFELARDVGVVPADETEKKPEQTTESIEQQVLAVLAAREKAAEEKRLADDKAKEVSDQKAAAEQMDTFLTSSATFLRANLDKFPFIKAWGCDSGRYTALLIEHAEKHHVLPEPEVLLQAMEDEHKAKWMKGPYAPKEPPPLEDLDAHVARTYREHKPATPDPNPRKLTAYEEAKRDLEAYDREQRERVRYGQG
jgi:hypothetical protein